MPQVHVAIAILHQAGQFLLQLRDDIPGIYYPGCWGFFGGHVEPEEAPDVAVRRELLEEIGYAPPVLELFARYDMEDVVRHVYYGRLEVPVEALQLNEGWDLGLLSLEDIRRGDRYSERAGQVRPLGQPHQQILLEFVERGFLETRS